MAISFSPAAGELLDCDFGEYVEPPLRPIYNGLLPNEMRKKRMVVVMNGKLPNGCCLVIPVSSSGNPGCVKRGFHVYLAPELITETKFYDKRCRWVVTECVTHVSKMRLYRIKNNGVPISDRLPISVMEKVRRAMIQTLNAGSLLWPVERAKEPVLETARIDFP
jgi:uncharacterized protein YifN (PemK superfamily)